MRARQETFGIDLAVGAVAVVVCCAVPTGSDQQARDARLGLLALGVGVFAAGVLDAAAVAATVGIAFLIFDGFVEGRRGELGWSGTPDAVRLAVLCAAGVFGLLVGSVHRWRARHRPALSDSPADHIGVPRQRSAADHVHEEL